MSEGSSGAGASAAELLLLPSTQSARPLPDPPTKSTPADAAAASSVASSSSMAAAAVQSTAPGQQKNGMATVNEPIACNACKQGLEETLDNTVVSFGQFLYHVDCFRCAKCHNLVEHDTNLLLLSDGNPVCENCSYICSVCQKPIQNEAIVTGDESYHADCFRCRSCSNKIEELIFAKTTAGIWCMACHNERVARTRKNAEAKRSKSVRTKERTGTNADDPSSKSSRHRSDKERERDRGTDRDHDRDRDRERERERERERRKERERERERERSRPPTGNSVTGSVSTPTKEYFDIPPIASASGSHQHRPLPPSPYGHGPSASASTMSLADIASSTTIPTSKLQLRPTRPPPLASLDLKTSSSSQSLNKLGAGVASSPTAATASGSLPGIDRARSPSGPLSSRDQQDRVASPGPASALSNAGSRGAPISPIDRDRDRTRPSVPTPTAASSVSGPAPPTLSPMMEESSSSTGDENAAGGGLRSPALSSLASQSRNGSLSAPTTAEQKSANRRSGFYGSMSARGSIDENALASGVVVEEREDGDADQHAMSHGHHTAVADMPRSESSSSSSFLPDLHQSMSFYDPDTLLFLNHVGSGPSSPQGHVTSSAAVPHYGEDVPSSEQVERIYTSSSHDEDGADAGVGLRRAREPRTTDVSRKLRESIRSSRQAGDSTGGGLDVELVEMLLGELDGTKKEMQELQGQYSAFRRASRSAFEGFSMAREEYDKELAARRDAEHKMSALRAKFVEQAQRLAAVDQEQKNAEALKRQSKELRSSVVGMEKHLSVLRAEVELSTAQAAELAALDTAKADIRSNGGDRSSAASADLAAALSSRLEAVKATHRQEISDLIAERDAIAREVTLLRETRDAHDVEVAALQSRQAELTQKNAEAAQQLEMTREAIAKTRMLSSSPLSHLVGNNGASRNMHQHSLSSVSQLGSLPPVTTRSPLSVAPPSATGPNSGDFDPQLYRFTKPEAAEPTSGKKFKWGKGKMSSSSSSSSAAADHHHTAATRSIASSSTATGHSITKSSSSSASAAVMRSGSTDSGVRTHTFQQTSILRPVRCDYCGDKMWGLNEVRCTACGSYAHTKCAGYLTTTCSTSHSSHTQDDTISIISSAPVMFGNDLTAQTLAEGREVPLVVSKCIAAVEAYGMNYEGIYRKTGGMGQTKLITQYFERGEDFDLKDLDRFNDVAAVTSCLKNFFRCLPVPLFTHDLHEQFVSCSEMSDGEERLQTLEKILRKLPDAHYFTARMLLHHLHRIHLASNENKMTPANLGVVFGPTVLRSSVASREYSDMGAKAKIIEILVEQAPRLFPDQGPPPS